MADKFSAFGAVLGIGDTDDVATAVFTDVANISNIGGPSESLDPVDVTTHDSPKAFREFVAGVADAGEVTLDLVYDEAEATQGETSGLIYQLEERLVKAFQITTTGTTKKLLKFKALVTAFEPTWDFDGAQTASVTLKISSFITWADAP